MVIRMKKMSKDLSKKTKQAIIVIVIAIFMVLISIAMRKSSYTQTWLVCNTNKTNNYYEELKFRYDINNKLYGYYRYERLYGLTEETLNANYQERLNELDRVRESLSDNFQYEVKKENNEVIINTYIGVSVFPNFFNNYIATDSIRSTSTVEDIKSFLEANDYKCEVTRK